MIEKLLREIANLDIQPSVYKVFLTHSDHYVGFNAFVDFRTNVEGPSSIETHAETPEKALISLKNELIANFGKCQHCGQYHHPL